MIKEQNRKYNIYIAFLLQKSKENIYKIKIL